MRDVLIALEDAPHESAEHDDGTSNGGTASHDELDTEPSQSDGVSAIGDSGHLVPDEEDMFGSADDTDMELGCGAGARGSGDVEPI